jgi:stage V sporulation protein G
MFSKPAKQPCKRSVGSIIWFISFLSVKKGYLGGTQVVEITRVTVREIDMNMVKGIASIILDDCFVIHDLRVVDGDRGYFVAMPSRKLPNGDFKDIAHPLNSETREKIQEAVLREFFKVKRGESEPLQEEE